VVAERERVGAGREQPLREPRCQPGAVGRVLAVDDAGVDLELVAQRGKQLLDRAPAGGAEDVRYVEKLQGVAAAVAWCTSTATWLP
jgi:hypothetical protein